MLFPWLKKSDVVIVTGGSNGLGAQLVLMFARRGYPVASLDLTVPDPDARIEGVLHLACDITDYDSILRCRSEVERELGVATVLINNAGIRTKMAALADMPVDDFVQTLKVNLAGSFATIKAFLPAMVAGKRGFVVNVASALGMISPAGLSAYGASKAGVIAVHESLTYENSAVKGLKLLLVCPGQLDTAMFSDLKTPSRLLAPIVSQTTLAKMIAKRVERGRDGYLSAPFYVTFVPWMRVVPHPVASVLRRASGVDHAYKTAASQT